MKGNVRKIVFFKSFCPYLLLLKIFCVSTLVMALVGEIYFEIISQSVHPFVSPVLVMQCLWDHFCPKY